MAGVAGTKSKSARAITPQKMAEKKTRAHLHIITNQPTKFQINPIKDVGGVAGPRFRTDIRTDGRKDGRTHNRTVEGRFYSPPPPTSGDYKRFITGRIDGRFVG